MAKTITSIEQFRATYFPRSYEEERVRKMSPEEKGRYLAEKTIKKFRPELEGIFKNL